MSSGEVFAALDGLLDQARSGPLFLRQPAIARTVVDSIQFNAEKLRHYSLHAYAIMPNHVHMLATPAVPLAILTKSLKGISAKRANTILRRTGQVFWQEESYDHLVRDSREFEKIQNYIEQNPVRAGLVTRAGDYPWSSAAATRGSPADEGVRPTEYLRVRDD